MNWASGRAPAYLVQRLLNRKGTTMFARLAWLALGTFAIGTETWA